LNRDEYALSANTLFGRVRGRPEPGRSTRMLRNENGST
jgi:hypothetical protein